MLVEVILYSFVILSILDRIAFVNLFCYDFIIFYIYFSTVLEKGGKNSLIIYRPRKSFLQNPLPSSAFLLVHFFGAGSGRGTRLKTTFEGMTSGSP